MCFSKARSESKHVGKLNLTSALLILNDVKCSRERCAIYEAARESCRIYLKALSKLLFLNISNQMILQLFHELKLRHSLESPKNAIKSLKFPQTFILP